MKTYSVVRLICVTALFYCLVQIYHNYCIRLDKEHLYHVMSDIGINMDGKLCSIAQIFLSIKSVSPKTQYQLCILKYKKRAKIQKTEILVSGEAFSPAWFFCVFRNRAQRKRSISRLVLRSVIYVKVLSDLKRTQYFFLYISIVVYQIIEVNYLKLTENGNL